MLCCRKWPNFSRFCAIFGRFDGHFRTRGWRPHGPDHPPCGRLLWTTPFRHAVSSVNSSACQHVTMTVRTYSSVYRLFVWSHHRLQRDNPCTRYFETFKRLSLQIASRTMSKNKIASMSPVFCILTKFAGFYRPNTSHNYIQYLANRQHKHLHYFVPACLKIHFAIAMETSRLKISTIYCSDFFMVTNTR